MVGADEDGKGSGLSPRAQQLKEELLGEFSLTVDDVAGILEVDRSTVYRYIQDGALAGLKIGREYRLSEVDVKGFLQALIARERQRVNGLRLRVLTALAPVAPPAPLASSPPAVVELGPEDGLKTEWGEAVAAVWSQAWEEAKARGHIQTHPVHVLLALTSDAPYRRWQSVFRGQGYFRDSFARQALDRLGIDIPTLRRAVEAVLPTPELQPGEGLQEREHSTQLKELAQKHMPVAKATAGRRWIGTDALLLGLYAVPETAEALRSVGAGEDAVRAELQRLVGYPAQAPAGPQLAIRARHVVHLALELAMQGRSRVATPEHLLLALTSELPVAREGIARHVLDEASADLAAIRKAAEANLPAPVNKGEWSPDLDPEPSTGLRTVVLERAVAAARGLGHDHVGTAHLLLGLYSIPEIAALLEPAGVEHAKVRSRVRRLLPPKAPQPEERRPMFGRYSERAQRVITQAQSEARTQGSGYVGTHHLFLALLADGIGGIALKALENLGVAIPTLRAAVEASLPPPQMAPGEPKDAVQFTPKGKALIMDQALAAAQQLGHAYVGTEHLLLGLYAEEQHAALLEKAGALQEAVEAQIFKLLGGDPGTDSGPVFDQSSQAVIKQAQEEAKRLGALVVHPGHILLALTSDVPVSKGGGARAILERLDVDIEAMCKRMASTLPGAAAGRRRNRGEAAFTGEGTTVVSRHAPAAARSVGARQVSPEHLLLGLYPVQDIADLLTAAGAPEDAVRVEVARMSGAEPETRSSTATIPLECLRLLGRP